MPYGTGRYTYELVDGWAKCPEGYSFLDVGGLCVDAQDRVYVLNRGTRPVMVFDPQGNLLASWGDGLFERPHGVYIGPDGFVYCTDDGNHTVSKFTPDGKLLLTLGTNNQPSDTGYTRQPRMSDSLATIVRGGPPFNRPTDVALSASGEIYVSDGYGNARVHKFRPDGTWLMSWGEPGDGPGQFRLPHAICIDKYQRVWVTDRENGRLQIFDAQGKFLRQWTGLKHPGDIFIDDEETVYVAELGRRLSIFTIDGNLLSSWGSEGQDKETALFLAPHTIAVDSGGDLYVGEVAMSGWGIDRGARAIQKFARTG
ncbi:MAG: hypothetical protein HW402_32 [Dehalococcoidales bacterium]|nr:hypothetical protein [Dehalococcoidales bacterium]